jgi:hypothetical protein
MAKVSGWWVWKGLELRLKMQKKKSQGGTKMTKMVHFGHDHDRHDAVDAGSDFDVETEVFMSLSDF